VFKEQWLISEEQLAVVFTTPTRSTGARQPRQVALRHRNTDFWWKSPVKFLWVTTNIYRWTEQVLFGSSQSWSVCHWWLSSS